MQPYCVFSASLRLCVEVCWLFKQSLKSETRLCIDLRTNAPRRASLFTPSLFGFPDIKFSGLDRLPSVCFDLQAFEFV